MEYFESLAWKDYFYTYLAATYSVIQTNLLVLIILVYRLSTGKLKPMHKLVLSVTVVAMLRGLLVLPVRTHHQRHKWTTSESLCRAFIGMDILLYSTYQGMLAMLSIGMVLMVANHNGNNTQRMKKLSHILPCIPCVATITILIPLCVYGLKTNIKFGQCMTQKNRTIHLFNIPYEFISVFCQVMVILALMCNCIINFRFRTNTIYVAFFSFSTYLPGHIGWIWCSYYNCGSEMFLFVLYWIDVFLPGFLAAMWLFDVEIHAGCLALFRLCCRNEQANDDNKRDTVEMVTSPVVMCA